MRGIGLAFGLIAGFLAFGALTPHNAARAQTGEVVDLELALLVDCSASVNAEEYRLQAEGLAWAIRNPELLRALESLTNRGIAIAVIQWSDEVNQRFAIPWTHIRDSGDAVRLAARVQAMPRLINGGHTGIGSALTFAARAIEANAFDGVRRIIDLSGDGRNNAGRPLRTARRDVLAQGITINGLAILNELPFLDRYFHDHMIGGDGAFHVIANDYEGFAEAMAEKLLREIELTPISRQGEEPATAEDGARLAKFGAVAR